MTENDFIWRFTPSRTEPEVLESIFVQRQNLLTSILDRVSESATTGNKHHMLLIGPRGIGKTHLISLLNYRIQQKPKLAKRLRIAWFLEDETITSYVQLLKRIYQLLSEEYPAEFPIEWLNDLLDESPEQIEKALEAELVRGFENQTLLLFIENLDYVFDGLSKAGQQKWRSFLQEHPFTCIVATSQRLFSGMKDREQPFFGFFTPIHLKPLQVGDAVDLLRHIAEQRNQRDLEQYLQTPEGRSRIRALHHLAGGNHRIYIVLSGFITRDSLDELTQPFEKMADELTPYYQERMRWLSPQQRQIVELLCAQTAPCTPKEMARQLLAGETSISSQLKKLLEYGYVMKSPRGRESLYELTEPLMRLASEVKDKRRKPLRLLVDFLRIWYRPDHLTQLMQTTGSDSLRAHISAALDRSKSSPDPRLKAICEDVERAREEGNFEDLVAALEEQVHTTPTKEAWLELGCSQNELKLFAKAIQSFDQVLGIDPECTDALSEKGFSLYCLNRFEDVVSCLNQLLESDAQDVSALGNKSLALVSLNRYEESLDCSDMALQIDRKYVPAWNSKGLALQGLSRYEESLSCFDAALNLNRQFESAWSNKGFLLQSMGRHEEAMTCYDAALEIAPDFAYVLVNKGSLLHNAHRYDEAIACFDEALRLESRYALAWSGKGSSLHNLARHDEAIVCLNHALEIDPEQPFALNAKGSSLLELSRYEEALLCYENALKFGPNFVHAMFNRVEPLFALNRWESGFEGLRQSFVQHPAESRHDVTSIVHLVESRSVGSEERNRHVRTLVEIYAEGQALPHLGDGLVRSLGKLDADRLSEKALAEWRDAWREAASEYLEMEIPLRIFSVGIEYLTKKDERVLLDLIATERRILQQALGLESATESDSER